MAKTIRHFGFNRSAQLLGHLFPKRDDPDFVYDLRCELRKATGEAYHTHEVKAWLCTGDNRVEPKLGIGITLLECAEKLMKKTASKIGKAALVAFCFLSFSSNALVLENAYAIERSATPPPFAFGPWDTGLMIVMPNGAVIGETNRPTGCWPIGPNACVWAYHIASTPPSSVIMPGKGQWPIVETRPVGNDLVIGRTDPAQGRFPTWNAVWRGWPNDMGRWGGLRAITNAGVMLSGGLTGINNPSISDGCAIQVGGFVKRWCAITNCEIGFSGWETAAIIINRTGPDAGGGGPQWQTPFGSAMAFNCGTMIGDSSGAVFAQDSGQWYLAGLNSEGASCRGRPTSSPLVWNASKFWPDFWRIVGQPDQSAEYCAWREKWFAKDPNYDTATPGPVVVPIVVPPQTPPLATNIAIVTLTNYVTVFRTNIVQVPGLTFQQRQKITTIREMLGWFLQEFTE